MSNSAGPVNDVAQRFTRLERKVDASMKCMYDLWVLVMGTNKLDASEGENLALKKDGTLCRFVDSENDGGSYSQSFGERPWKKAYKCRLFSELCCTANRRMCMRYLWIRRVVDAMCQL